jgi:hypothetical protein
MKIILHKVTGEYVHYLGNGEFYTASIPKIYPDGMDMNSLKEYIEKHEGVTPDLSDFEIKSVEINIID